MIEQCKCCGKIEDLRMGACWDCAESESVIAEGLDMYDQEIPKVDGMSSAMSKLQYILKKYITINPSLLTPKK